MAKAKSTEKEAAKVETTEVEAQKVETPELVTMTKAELLDLLREAKGDALKELESLKEEFDDKLKELEKGKTEPGVTAAERKSHSEGYIPETEEQLARANELVERIAPLDASMPEEINISVNGETIQILRGYPVKIPRKFADVLDNMTQQQMAFKKYQKEIEKQVTYVD